jgi:hypothetical protein
MFMRCKEYTVRKLTEEEKEFASRPENHNLIFKYMKIKKLDPEEFYDELIIDYLVAVKQYVTEKPELQLEYDFGAILFQRLNGAMMHYYRAKHVKKRMPKGGIASLEYMVQGDNPFAEYTPHEDWWIDTKTSVETQVILKELFREFYKNCITYKDVFYDEETVSEYRKYVLDLLLDGYSRTRAHMAAEEQFSYGYSYKDFKEYVDEFRRVFREVFGI